MGTERLLYERLVDFLENKCEIRKFVSECCGTGVWVHTDPCKEDSEAA